MPVPYVTFPGVNGNSITTPDVNLLDADTAHVSQSLGDWNVRGTLSAREQSQAITPVFGDYHGLMSFGAGYNGVATTGGLAAFPVIASTVYTASVSFASPTVGLTSLIELHWFDSGGVQLSYDFEEITPTAGWQRHHVTATAPANAVTASVWLSNGGGSGAGTLYWDAACLREGSDPTFVPSLRIVGDLDMSVRAAVTNYDSGVSQYFCSSLTANIGFSMYLLGNLIYGRYGDGASTRPSWSNALSVVDGAAYTFRYTMDVSTGVAAFSQDGAAIGGSTQTVSPGAVSGLALSVGAAGGSSPLSGDIYWAEVRDGIDGPIVARFDAADIPL